jgi:P pilus assembly chaperone PapD
MSLNTFFRRTLLAAVALYGAAALATGITPETSMLALSEADGTAQMGIVNTEDVPMLLHSAVRNLPEDDSLLVLPLPPVTRVEPKGRQVVRFVLEKPAEPLKVQHLKRVTFEGIPPKPKEPNSFQLTLRHDLPLIISPKGLEQIPDPWRLMQWRMADGKITVSNPSPYVVRLSRTVDLMPGAKRVDLLTRTYVLPGETVSLDLPADSKADISSVRIFPASPYGYAVEPYDVPLNAAAPVKAALAGQ